MAYTVKLDFNTDFTEFLAKDDYNDPICVVTESETIKCSAVLLAQHSSVLKEYLKEEKELFLTDNKHVRECLSILYGGSVKLTEENFQDILKFMVSFDIPSARDQVLNWMSQTRWNLDNASLLINGSIFVAKALHLQPEGSLDIENIFSPCRLIFKWFSGTLINLNATDDRYKTLDSAMESILPEIGDKDKLLEILLHEDLIPEYIHCITKLLNQSSYNLFLERLEIPDIPNKMAVLTRSQFEELFDKIEDFECITLKEYKRLNKYKMNINEKMTITQSLRFMKENGSLYSCWRLLDNDGMMILLNAFTDKTDQFCILECILSWHSANKSSASSGEILQKISSTVLARLIQCAGNMWLREYYTSSLGGWGLNQYKLPKESYELHKYNSQVCSQHGEVIIIELMYHHYQTNNGGFSNFKNGFPDVIHAFRIKLFKDRIPEVSAVDPDEYHEDNQNRYRPNEQLYK